jgi:WD40 repeat protein
VYAYAAYNYVVLADPATKATLAVLLGHGNKVTSLAASQPGAGPEILLSGSRDKSVTAWSVKQRSILRKRQKLDDEVTALVTVPNAPGLVVIACKNGALRSWMWEAGAPLVPLPFRCCSFVAQ